VRLPKSPDEQRAAKAARQKRWRDRKAQKEAVARAVDGSMGLGPPAPLPDMPEKDLAALVRDRVHSMVQDMPDARLWDKDLMPTLNTGLKAEAIIDKRKALAAKTGVDAMQLYAGLMQMLHGTPVPKQLEDGNTVEGVYVETK
jgi:hypothetical protein